MNFIEINYSNQKFFFPPLINTHYEYRSFVVLEPDFFFINALPYKYNAKKRCELIYVYL